MISRNGPGRILAAGITLVLATTAPAEAGRNKFLKNQKERIGEQKVKQAARDKMLDEDLPQHIREEREFREKMLKTMDQNTAAINSLRNQVDKYQASNAKQLAAIRSASDRPRSSGGGSGGGKTGGKTDPGSPLGSRGIDAPSGAKPRSIDGLSEIAGEVDSLNRKIEKSGGSLSDEDRKDLQERHFQLASKVKSITSDFSEALQGGGAIEGVDDKLEVLAGAHENLDQLQGQLWPSD